MGFTFIKKTPPLPAPNMSVEDALKVAEMVSKLSLDHLNAWQLTARGALLVLANELLRLSEKEE